MTSRRQFMSLLGGAAVMWPVAARAQQGERIRRVGIIMPYSQGDPEYKVPVKVLREELARVGWVEGQNVQFDERWTTDNVDRVRAEAASLLASAPNVVVAIGGRVIPVLVQISRSVPIVVPSAADPVGIGWVNSLARPGGNITGFTFFELSILGKMLEILKQIAPATSRVAFIYNPENPSSVVFKRTFELASDRLNIEPVAIQIHRVTDIEQAAAGLAKRPNTGVFFPPDVTISALREQVIALLARHRLPAIYSDPSFIRNGGLAFYGADRIDLFRRSAGYVDRILRGENPSDLPFQQPTKYQLMINLKTARALGLEKSPTLLAIADEVIE